MIVMGRGEDTIRDPEITEGSEGKRVCGEGEEKLNTNKGGVYLYIK